jgi:hypothetical protein
VIQFFSLSLSRGLLFYIFRVMFSSIPLYYNLLHKTMIIHGNVSSLLGNKKAFYGTVVTESSELSIPPYRSNTIVPDTKRRPLARPCDCPSGRYKNKSWLEILLVRSKCKWYNDNVHDDDHDNKDI